MGTDPVGRGEGRAASCRVGRTAGAGRGAVDGGAVVTRRAATAAAGAVSTRQADIDALDDASQIEDDVERLSELAHLSGLAAYRQSGMVAICRDQLAGCSQRDDPDRWNRLTRNLADEVRLYDEEVAHGDGLRARSRAIWEARQADAKVPALLRMMR